MELFGMLVDMGDGVMEEFVVVSFVLGHPVPSLQFIESDHDRGKGHKVPHASLPSGKPSLPSARIQISPNPHPLSTLSQLCSSFHHTHE